MRRPLSLFLVAFLVLAAILFVAADFSGGILGFVPDWRSASLVSLLALAIWIAPSLRIFQGRTTTALSYVAIWLAIAVAIALLYVYRAELGLPVG